MFERHFGLRENPFHSGHQMKFLYPSREHQEARAHLRYGIENREPFVLITGEVGTGKTTALYDALAEWGSRVSVALVTNSALSRQEMLEEIGLRFGMPLAPGVTKPQALAQLERHLNAVRSRGEHAVLLMDEAQNLAPDLLEEIRLLSNLETQGERLVQIFLVGQPELEAKLADPQLRQLRQRIGVHYRLNPLSPEETAGYIHHRIGVAGGNPWATFPPESCLEVYRVTHGIPREINTVATQAMITAFGEGAAGVTPEHVRTVARENDFRSVLGAPAQVPEGVVPMPPIPPAPVQAAPVEPPPAPAPVAAPAPPVAPRVWSQPAPAPRPRIEPPAAAAAPPVWSPPVLEPASPGALVHEEPPAAAASSFEPPAPPAPLSPAPVAEAPAPEPAPAPAPAAPRAERVERVEKKELDAWTIAAHDLMEARKRNAAALGETLEEEAEPVAAQAPERVPAHFPTIEELESRSATARPDRADLSGLSPRLRQKIEDDLAREERRGGMMPALFGAITLLAVAVGLVLAQRFQMIDLPFLRGIAGARPAAQHAAAVPPAAEPVVPAVVPAVPATQAASDTSGTAAPKPASVTPTATPKPATTTAIAPATPKPTTTTAAVKPAPVATTPPPAATKPAATAAASTAKPATPTAAAAAPATGPAYGIGVASYLDRDRAVQERDRLTSLSKLPGQVLPYQNAGTMMYRVVLGSYPSRDAADIASSSVMAKYSLHEATPVQIAKPK